MFKERTLATAALAIVALIAFGSLRPDSPRPREEATPDHTRFFIDKTRQAGRYEGVVLGDSRGLRGIAPEILEASIPGDEVYNFSFHAGGMNEEMYRRAERLLDPDANRPWILLAPTSLSLLPATRTNSQFHEFRSKSRDVVWLHRHALPFVRAMRSIRLSSFAHAIAGATPEERLYQEFHEGGWIETDQAPHDPPTNLSAQRRQLTGHACLPSLIEGLFAQTAEWSDRGIRVFALFPPAYRPLVSVQDSVLGLDRRAFTSSFEAAGGIMIEPDTTGLDTYDNSHLTGDSARRYSARVGEILARHLRPGETPGVAGGRGAEDSGERPR